MTGLSIKKVLTAPRSPWQNSYVERVIGSIRRECLDHTIILGERHLRRVVGNYVSYYNTVRTHLSLSKDALAGRPIQTPDRGRVVERPHVGGLHHEYFRKAAYASLGSNKQEGQVHPALLMITNNIIVLSL